MCAEEEQSKGVIISEVNDADANATDGIVIREDEPEEARNHVKCKPNQTQTRVFEFLPTNSGAYHSLLEMTSCMTFFIFDTGPYVCLGNEMDEWGCLSRLNVSSRSSYIAGIDAWVC